SRFGFSDDRDGVEDACRFQSGDAEAARAPGWSLYQIDGPTIFSVGTEERRSDLVSGAVMLGCRGGNREEQRDSWRALNIASGKRGMKPSALRPWRDWGTGARALGMATCIQTRPRLNVS